MNALDVIILIPLIWGIYKGFTRGLIVELASIVAVILAVWGAVTFSDKVAHYLRDTFNWQLAHSSLLVFTLLFIAILILVMLLGKLLTGIVDAVALGIANKLLGALFGAFKYLLLISVLFFILAAADRKIEIISAEVKQKSILYKPVSAIAITLIPALKNSKPGGLLTY